VLCSDKNLNFFLIFMDLVSYIGLLVMYAVPAAMIVLSLTVINNILLLMVALTWLGTSLFIHFVQ